MQHDLMIAIFKGDTDEFDRLLRESSTDVTTVTEPDKWNYLHRALVSVTKTPPADAIRHLISIGVPVNGKDRYGNTPLHYAARAKNVEAMKALLDAGANIDAVNRDGVTPLRQLLLRKPDNLEAVELLLAHGADMHQRYENGATVKEYVQITANVQDRKLLELFEKYDNESAA